MELIYNKIDKRANCTLYEKYTEVKEGKRKASKRKDLLRERERAILYNLSERSRRKWLWVQLFKVPIHLGQFLGVSLKEEIGSGWRRRKEAPTASGRREALRTCFQTGIVLMKSLWVKLLPWSSGTRGAPFVEGGEGERNPDHISSTQALKRTSYERFREIINLYAAAFGRA